MPPHTGLSHLLNWWSPEHRKEHTYIHMGNPYVYVYTINTETCTERMYTWWDVMLRGSPGRTTKLSGSCTLTKSGVWREPCSVGTLGPHRGWGSEARRGPWGGRAAVWDSRGHKGAQSFLWNGRGYFAKQIMSKRVLGALLKLFKRINGFLAFWKHCLHVINITL